MINNKLFRGFTFDGVNSLDYDIYITGEGVYNAPERAVEKVSVPGRNGDLTIDQGRFENIEVTYADCGCAATTQEEFAEKIAAFRNALCSRIGYKRLTDDYNKDEFRMAMYVSGLEVEAIAQHRMGTFDIVFDAMPQRFLSGEVPKVMAQNMVPSSTNTESGSIVSLESDGGDAVTSLVAQITPTQAGSGDPSPTNVRAITGWTEAKVFDTGKNLVDESTAIGFNAAVTVDGGYISVTKNASSNYPAAHINTYLRAGVTYTVSATCVQATAQAKLAIRNIAPSNTTVTNSASYSEDGQRKSVTYTPTKSGMYRVALFSSWGEADTGTAIFTDIQCEVGSTATPYEPFTGTTTTTTLGQTVYGGTLDVVSGVLTVDRGIVDLGTLYWTRVSSFGGSFLTTVNDMKENVANAMCSAYPTVNTGAEMTASNSAVYAKNNGYSVYVKDSRYTDVTAFKAAMNGVQLCYELATPQTYNLTALKVDLLVGNSHVWASTGDITLTYGADPYKVINPTLFESKPLLMVTGRGTLSVGDVTITITGTASQVLYIDCDIMEVYSITDGQMQPQNSLVTMNSYDFPKLKPGANKITLGVGITQVVVTPRWWRV